MEVSAIFWVATTVMAVIAVLFIARPLLVANRNKALLALVIAVPLGAAGIYLTLGSPASAGPEPSASRSPAMPTPPTTADGKVGSVDSMVDGLARRLQDNPDDADSWLLLARSYEHLNRIPEAVAAYERAVALGQYDSGLAALASGETVATTSQIAGSVRLSDSAASIVEPTDTVFVFAKAVDGPPMPIAVLRRAASELPIDFVLNDQLSMTPDLKLSDFATVVVTARISRGGDATIALRDLEAHSATVDIADGQRIELTIQ